MRTIYVSPEFPLNRRMRKDVRRGKLQVVREGGERSSLGGGIPSGKRRGLRTTGSRLVCMVDNGAGIGGVPQEHPRVHLFRSRFGGGNIGAQACSSTLSLNESDSGDNLDTAVMQKVDETLVNAKILLEDPDLNPYFARQLGRYEMALSEGVKFLRDKRHPIVFIGEVGVGKTRMICGLTDLQYTGKDGKKKSALIVGPGGTTVCEVRIGRGRENRYSLMVEPRDKEEIKAYVAEWSDYMMHVVSPKSEQSKNEKPSVPTEISRVIRNMSGLAETRIVKSGGRRELVDPAKSLAMQFGNAEDFQAEVLQRMKLDERRRTEVTGADMEWLRRNFADINDGKNPDFSIPERMDVFIPAHALGDEETQVGLDISITDTKGVNETAARADLMRHFDDPRALVVLCSEFKSAPAPAMQLLLERARDSGALDISEKTSVLVLPHGNEATDTQREDDDLSDEEAYEEKGEQAKAAIFGLGVGDISIKFYNVEKENANDVRAFFIDRIGYLRGLHRERLRELSETTRALMENREKAVYWAQLGEAAWRLMSWMDGRDIDESDAKIEDELLTAIRDVRYASSLHASVRRAGMWPTFNYYDILGGSERKIAFARMKKWLSDFNANADGIENDRKLLEAHGFVRETRKWLESACDDLLKSLVQECGDAFKVALKDDNAHQRLWGLAQAEWGRGPGYKIRVMGHNQKWFDHEVAADVAKHVESQFIKGWRDVERQLRERLSVSGDTE